MTAEQIQAFFKARPACTVAGIAKELGIARQHLHAAKRGEEQLSPARQQQLMDIMKRYGWG